MKLKASIKTLNGSFEKHFHAIEINGYIFKLSANSYSTLNNYEENQHEKALTFLNEIVSKINLDNR